MSHGYFVRRASLGLDSLGSRDAVIHGDVGKMKFLLSRTGGLAGRALRCERYRPGANNYDRALPW